MVIFRINAVPKLKKLIDKGFVFGLNDFIVNKSTINNISMLLKYVEYVKIDALNSDETYVDKLLEYLKGENKKIVASKIETHELYEAYKLKGVDYFQGYYLKRPNIIKTTAFNASQTQILEVWNLIKNEATTKEIVLELEKNHALTLKLMQFINSSFFSFRTQISSMNQIINLLGRDALANWLLIFMVSERGNSSPVNHPLLFDGYKQNRDNDGAFKAYQAICIDAGALYCVSGRYVIAYPPFISDRA